MTGAPAPRSVLVVVTRQIGDVLLTTPLLHEARRLWPQARIEVLGFPATLEVLQGNPDVDGVVPMERGSGLGAVRRLARRIWRRYDLALVAEFSDRAHLAGWLAARRRVGLLPPDAEGGDWWKRRTLVHAVRSEGDRGALHVVREKLRLLAPWADGQAPQPRVVPPAALPLPAPLAAALQPGYVVVHAPSMWAYKQWPLAHYAQLVDGLLQAGRQVVLTGGPAQQDRDCIAGLQAGRPPAQVLDAGVLAFGQLAGLLAGAALYVGPDTSVSHLAAACGAPVVALFGPTNPLRWAPWPGRPATTWFARSEPLQQAGNVTLLQGSQPCVPCGRAGCEDRRDSTSACLQETAPARVLSVALARLAGT